MDIIALVLYAYGFISLAKLTSKGFIIVKTRH